MNYNNPPRCRHDSAPQASIISLRSLFAALTTAAIFTVPISAWCAAPDDFKEATRLYQQGKLDQALSKVEAGLAQAPKDPQGRFTKGLILTEQKKTTEAIQVFTGITEDYPELPEPYNNLAVLYASQGNYDKARASLELAIHTHPAYATAHENLGDIYAQLARRAYDKALQLDKTNVTAQSKLAMVKEMFSVPKAPVQVAQASSAPSPTLAAASKPEPIKPAVKPEPAKVEPAKVAAVKPEPAKTEPTKSSPTPAAAPANAGADGVKAAVLAWAKAWAAKDVPAYLGFYGPGFVPPDGLSRTAWEAQRKERIERPTSIKVEVSFVSVSLQGNEAKAIFRQAYKSDTLTSNNVKTMRLVRTGDRWLIAAEKAGG